MFVKSSERRRFFFIRLMSSGEGNLPIRSMPHFRCSSDRISPYSTVDQMKFFGEYRRIGDLSIRNWFRSIDEQRREKTSLLWIEANQNSVSLLFKWVLATIIHRQMMHYSIETKRKSLAMCKWTDSHRWWKSSNGHSSIKIETKRNQRIPLPLFTVCRIKSMLNIPWLN